MGKNSSYLRYYSAVKLQNLLSKRILCIKDAQLLIEHRLGITHEQFRQRASIV